MSTQQTNDEITRLYSAAFNRAPDPAGLVYWENTADAGWTVPQIAGYFASSPEFITHYGALDDWQFVEQLYQNVLGRHGDPAGATYWQGALAAGDTRGNVLDDFAQSAENVRHTAALLAPQPVAAVAPALVVPHQAALVAPVTPPPAAVIAPAPENPQPIAPVAEASNPTEQPDFKIGTPEANQTIEIQNGAPPGLLWIQTLDGKAPPSTLILDHPPPGHLANPVAFSGFPGILELGDLQFDKWDLVPHNTSLTSGSAQLASGLTITFMLGGQTVYTLDDVHTGGGGTGAGIAPDGHAFFTAG